MRIRGMGISRIGVRRGTVSDRLQETESQIRAIRDAGFGFEPHRIITETASGSVAMAQRKGFSRHLDKMEQGDLLVGTELDRLGRDAIDVSMTVGKLEMMGIRLHCLSLGGTDLTSSAGRMTMNVINSVAQFERNPLIERTQAGTARARAQEKRPGRPAVLTPDQRQVARNRIRNGETIPAILREMKTSRQTIMRVRDQGWSCGTSCTFVRIAPSTDAAMHSM